MKILRRGIYAILFAAVAVTLSFVLLGLRFHADAAARRHIQNQFSGVGVKFYVMYCIESVPTRVTHGGDECRNFYIPRSAEPDLPKELTIRL
jgi:hypothetical protein